MPHETKHWIALSLTLPEYVHLETVTSVRIDEEFLANQGFGPDNYDGRWMQLPLDVQVGWKRVEKPIHRAVELAFAAAEALDEFVHYERERPIADVPLEIPEATSVAVCVLPVLDPDAARQQQDGLLDPLTLAYRIVADAVRSVRLIMGIPLQDLTYRQLSPIVPTLTGTQADGSVVWGDTSVVMLQHHMDTLMSGERLPGAATELTGHVIYQLAIARPAVVVRDHVERAKALVVQGDYAGAIVAFATACEVCLDNLLSALLWETGQTPSEAAAGWHNSASRRAKTRFAPLIGGNWNLNTSVPLKTWMEQVAKPRHRIVHSGEKADPSAAENARVAAEGLFAFVAELLVKRGIDYPRTVSLLLGHESLRRYGGAQTDVLLAAHQEHNDRWEREFREWRREWQDLIWS
ncbi:hypothetical protein [Prescottella equi]